MEANLNIIKRKRSQNWVEEDKILLQELIKNNVKHIENKKTDTFTNNAKKKAWLDVEEKFNSLCMGGQRSLAQLKTQWVATKVQARKRVATHRREVLKTGGGAQPSELSEFGDDISVWLPNEFIIDTNQFDSDGFGEAEQVVKEGHENNVESAKHTSLSTNKKQISKETEILQADDETDVLTKGHSPLKTINNTQSLQEPETPTTSNTVEMVKSGSKENISLQCASKKSTVEMVKSGSEEIISLQCGSKKRLKLSKNSLNPTAQNISKIADFDIVCRKELHALQVEVERKKMRNLDRELDLIEAKIKFYKKKSFDNNQD